MPNISLNKHDEVAILIVSCDTYHDLWPAFFTCFFRYWPDCPFNVYLGTNYLDYSTNRVKTIRVGKDLSYSSNLISMLENLEHQWIILWIEDRLLAGSINTNRIHDIIQFAKDEKIGYIRLISSFPYALTQLPSCEFGEIPKGQKYRVCMTVALWNKDLLVKILTPGETAWEIEKKGSLRSNNLDDKFLSLSFKSRNYPPIKDKHLIIKGKISRDAQKFIENEGLSSYLENRKQQSFLSFLYVKSYLVINLFFHMIRWIRNTFITQ